VNASPGGDLEPGSSDAEPIPHLERFRVVADRLHRRTSQDEVGGGTTRTMLGEALQNTGRVLEAVEPRDLSHDAVLHIEGRLLDQLSVAVHSARCAVGSPERRVAFTTFGK
jgi:hypothetical protein